MSKFIESIESLILKIHYLSKEDESQHRKRRTYVQKTIGYGLAIVAFAATLYSFVSDRFNPTEQALFFILFSISFLFTWRLDGKDRIINDLSSSLEKDTKDLIYSYKRLKNHEIEARYKDFFSEFTRYTPYVLGVQVYNYSIFSTSRTKQTIKLEYEYGAVQESIDINAVIQNYYHYNKSDIIRISKSLLSLRLHNNAVEAFTVLDSLSTRIKDSAVDPSYELALWNLLVSEIKEYGQVNFTVEELQDLLLNGESSKPDKRIGIFTAIIYSDLLKLKEQHLFGYRGSNNSKDNRLYVTIKSESVKGAKKIFLIVLDSDILKKDIMVDEIISQFEALLQANSLVESSFKLNKKDGSVQDAIEHIHKNHY
ncbi:hypothetical protein [Exiguobacterium sp. SRB7LM]|uniref:hypothetical protein n=1 Tax=Exiguobacterium sp. SRB7LM TaxID=2608401 RepID=UPI0018C423D5|nr:hypothetical protein [Exiguobacterium sp. SRB7LM]MBG0916238.1 hypothetical protein [Exiguobacterium sp. SRB7LM]